jgi:hypothetical protein
MIGSTSLLVASSVLLKSCMNSTGIAPFSSEDYKSIPHDKDHGEKRSKSDKTKTIHKRASSFDG